MTRNTATRTIFGALINRRILNTPCDPSTQSSRPFQLTSREKEVMGFILQGKTSWEISIILDISQSGVRKHIANIYRTYRTNNKVSAVIAYLCHETIAEHIAAQMAHQSSQKH